MRATLEVAFSVIVYEYPDYDSYRPFSAKVVFKIKSITLA